MQADHLHIIKTFKSTIVFHPRYRQAFSQIQNAIENTQALGEPACALLCGPSGTGKSTLCFYFRKLYSSEATTRLNDGTYVNLPVFYCEVPSPATVKGLIINMLRMLINETPNGTTEKLTHQLVTSLRTAQVKIIFLDEIQRLCVTTTAAKVRLDSLQWIVSLLNALGIPVILCGTQECHDIRHEDAAFERRYPYFAELSHFNYGIGKNSDYLATLKNLDNALYQNAVIEKGLHLNDSTFAAPLFVGTRGNLGTMRLIINDALKICLIRKGQRKLMHNDFVTACQSIDLPRNLSDGNPFALSYEESLKLILEHEDNKDE
jgi:energy-coupling factor transporter ATP-binding protein EcfA2